MSNTTQLVKGAARKVNGHDVILTGQSTTGKNNGCLYYAVQIVSYSFKVMGRPTPTYGKPQWVRASMLT